MNGWDWTPYLQGGALRPDAITGLQPAFNTSLAGMFAAAPPEIRNNLRMFSAYRSPEVQGGLWEAALTKYGSPEAARKWVAPPGKSKHNSGQAADLRYLNDAAREWVHANAANHGLTFPMAHENWHIEPIGARDGTQPKLSFPASVPPVDTSVAGMFQTPLEAFSAPVSLGARLSAPQAPQARAADTERRAALADLIRY